MNTLKYIKKSFYICFSKELTNHKYLDLGIQNNFLYKSKFIKKTKKNINF